MTAETAASGSSAAYLGEPAVSVIMPVRNEADHIGRSLGAVLDQDYSETKLEIIVVDGDSDDGTPRMVQEVVASHPRAQGVPVTLLNNPQRWVPASLNLALTECRGEVIVRVDGHCEIPSDYVARCIEALNSSGADCAGGVLETVGEGRVGSTIAAAQTSPFGVGNARFRYTNKADWVDTIAFGAYRREVFDRLGGFDEELVRNQDDEMNFRLVASGGRIWLDPAIRVVYHGRGSLKALWGQYLEYGAYRVRVIQKRRAAASWRHLVPAVFVLVIGSGLGLWFATGRHELIALISATYGVASLIASAMATRSRLHLAPLVMTAFTTMHLAYGLGFFAGAWRWRGHMRDLIRGHDQMQETV